MKPFTIIKQQTIKTMIPVVGIFTISLFIATVVRRTWAIVSTYSWKRLYLQCLLVAYSVEFIRYIFANVMRRTLIRRGKQRENAREIEREKENFMKLHTLVM